MLILERRPGESIFITHDIKVKVNRVRGQYVSLAIEAPKEIKIWREELKPFSEKGKENASD